MAKRKRLLIRSKVTTDKQKCLGDIVKIEKVSAGTKATIKHRDGTESKFIIEHDNIIEVDAPGNVMTELSDEEVIEVYTNLLTRRGKRQL